jgi:hypothetical protein
MNSGDAAPGRVATKCIRMQSDQFGAVATIR